MNIKLEKELQKKKELEKRKKLDRERNIEEAFELPERRYSDMQRAAETEYNK